MKTIAEMLEENNRAVRHARRMQAVDRALARLLIIATVYGCAWAALIAVRASLAY